jgi:hypothetical protein
VVVLRTRFEEHAAVNFSGSHCRTLVDQIGRHLTSDPSAMISTGVPVTSSTRWRISWVIGEGSIYLDYPISFSAVFRSESWTSRRNTAVQKASGEGVEARICFGFSGACHPRGPWFRGRPLEGSNGCHLVRLRPSPDGNNGHYGLAIYSAAGKLRPSATPLPPTSRVQKNFGCRTGAQRVYRSPVP